MNLVLTKQSRMSCKKEPADFEIVYKNIYSIVQQIHSELSKTTQVYPCEEAQQEKITALVKIPCAFGFLDELDMDRLTPVENLTFPFESQYIPNKYFFKIVHPSYLIPYLVFAKFAYCLARNIKHRREEVLNASYKIPVPIELRKGNGYSWYIQHAYPVSVNQHNQVISHLNLYTFDRKCLKLPNNEIENRFMEASVIVNNNLHEVFQNYLIEEVRKHLNEVFLTQNKQWKMIELLKEDTTLSNNQLAGKLELAVETIKDYNKQILDKIKTNLGYRFGSLREAVVSLKGRAYI